MVAVTTTHTILYNPWHFLVYYVIAGDVFNIIAHYGSDIAVIYD